MNNKDRACVIMDTTLGELQEIAKKSTDYRTQLYEKKIDRSDLSPEQMKLQYINKWYAEQNCDVRFWRDGLEKTVEKNVYDEVLGGCKENLEKKIYTRIMNLDAKIIGTIHDRDSNTKSVSAEINLSYEEPKQSYEYYDKLEDFEEELKTVKRRTSFNSDTGDIIWLEDYTISIYTNSFKDIGEDIKKLIKKTIRNKLTYCIKSGKVIIPEEYLEKGKAGIEEWRQIKSSSNKNNSMEKRILKATYREKRLFATDNMRNIFRGITEKHNSWKIPSLEIDGRYNQQKISALITEVFKDKSRQEFMELSEEDIMNGMKEYWKNILMDAYNAVDAIEIKKGQ